MFKKILFTLAPVFLLLIIIGFGSEIWLRQRHTSWDPNGADSGPRAHRECYRLSLTTGYEPIPNKCKRDEKGFYRTWEGPSNPEAYKTLVFGDSIADQHNWVQQTTAVFAEQSKLQIETKNAGTPGFDTCSELQMYRDKGLSEEQDHLLLQFCPNDLASTATIVALPNDRVRFFIGFEYVEFPRWMLQSRVVTWLAIQTFNRQQQSDGNRSASEPIEHCLQEFKTLTQEQNAQFSVVLFPSFVDNLSSEEVVFSITGKDFTTQSAEAKSRSLLEKLNIEYVEVRSFFEHRGLSLEEHRNAPHDLWHPNNEGQIIIGEDLGRWMNNQVRQQQ